MITFLAMPGVQSVQAYNETDHVKTIIKENYIYSVDEDVFKSNNLKEIFDKLDEHSTYYTREEFRSFMQGLNSSIGGIGVYIQKDANENVFISEVIKGSPAEKLGLKYGDTIVEIDGELANEIDIHEAAALIRGRVGSKLRLKILKKEPKEYSELEVIRANIKVDLVNYEIFQGNIGYLKINSFSEGVSIEVKQAIDYFNKMNAKKVIIDLRGNGGGLLNEALEISRIFIKKSPIVNIKNKDNIITHSSYTQKTLFSKEDLVILIDENSASASEIFAAAVKDNNAGTIVGKTSFGKGTVQRLYSLYSGAGFKLTESTYLSPKMKEIEGIGVIPDYEIERYTNDAQIDDIDLITIDNITHKRISVDGQEMVPIRDMFESLKYKVDWDQDSKSVVVTNEEKKIRLPVGKNTIYLDHEEVEIGEIIKIVNGTTVLTERAAQTVLRHISASEYNKGLKDLQIEFAIEFLNDL